MNTSTVDIYLKSGQTLTSNMEDAEVTRLTDDFANFVTSDNPANSGGVYNGNTGGTALSIFLAFDDVAAVVVHGMAAR